MRIDRLASQVKCAVQCRDGPGVAVAVTETVAGDSDGALARCWLPLDAALFFAGPSGSKLDAKEDMYYHVLPLTDEGGGK